jgi:hypothetical protein
VTYYDASQPTDPLLLNPTQQDRFVNSSQERLLKECADRHSQRNNDLRKMAVQGGHIR